MPWHPYWGDEQISMNEVKYLLSDLAKGLQERAALLPLTLAFPLPNGSTKEVVEPSDIAGMFISKDSGNDLKVFLDYLVEKFEEVVGEGTRTEFGNGFPPPFDIPGFPAKNWYTSSSFGTAYSWTSLLSAVGLMTESEVENTQNWRSKEWWLTLRGCLERLRYFDRGFTNGPSLEVRWFFHTCDWDPPRYIFEDTESGTFTGTGGTAFDGATVHAAFAECGAFFGLGVFADIDDNTNRPTSSNVTINGESREFEHYGNGGDVIFEPVDPDPDTGAFTVEIVFEEPDWWRDPELMCAEGNLEQGVQCGPRWIARMDLEPILDFT